MASRRARLKAVANLPVRRKPGGSEDAAEPPKIIEPTHESNIVEAALQENHTEKVPEPTPSIPEPEKPEEPTIEIKKDEKKPSGPAKFNRRLKPVVNLPIRKDKPPASDPETPDEIQNSTPVNNELSSPSDSTVPEKANSDSDSIPVNIEKIEPAPSLPQSPIKATQRPVFLRPNVDLNIRRPNDDVRNLMLSPRVRNVSECSNSSVIVQNVNTVQSDLTVGKGATTVLLKRKKPKSNDLSRKMADARREFHRRYEKIKPDRSSLRMIDLIFYNPTTNPMISKTKSEKKDGQSEEEILAEEKVDDPDGLDSSKTDDDMDEENLTRMPVPQVKIGLNGEIILDEKSLVIETTDAKRGREDLQNSVPVFEDRSTKMSYYCRKSKKSKDWTDSETKRFYKALNTIGTDFLLMQQLFPNRNRVELKNKFKREEKLNRNLIDKALNNPSEFDMTQLEKDLENENRIAEEETEQKLQKKAKPKTTENKNRGKSTLLSKEMVESDTEITFDPPPVVAPSQIVTRKTAQTEEDKKLKEVDMLYEKMILKTKPKVEERETIPAPSDQNQNLAIFNDFNKTDFKSHRRKSMHEPVEDLGEALDLTVGKKSPKPNRKRKLVKMERKKRKKKRETIVYAPDVEDPEKEDGDAVVTRTITDEDFYQLLAANMKNMKGSNIKVQVTEDRAPGSKKIEIILDEVPPITMKEIEDQNVTVLADYNTTICEDESPQSPEESDGNYQETSVIVKNPNVPDKNEEIETEETEREIENENVMLVLDESDQAEYQYIMVEQEVEPIEVEIPAEEIGQNVDVENVETEKITSPVPSSPALVLCKNPKTETEKMYLAGLSAGSFVLMASDAADQRNEKKLSMFMISEKAQSDGSSVLSSMPVMLPPDLLNSLTQELDCS